MATVTTIEKRQLDGSLPAPRARIGMIIPSVNSMTEPQFNHFAPPGLGVHVARARVAGEWKRPLAAMADEIATSAKLLADVAPDLIVFHCTDTSMTQGPRGEGDVAGRQLAGVLRGADQALEAHAALQFDDRAGADGGHDLGPVGAHRLGRPRQHGRRRRGG